MSSTAGGRRRAGPNTFTSSEDTALNMIAKEAEARLAAKRAARAEARSIRMKELERLQKEADEKMDKEYKRTTMITEDTIKKKIQNRLASTPPESEVDGPASAEVQVRILQDKLKDLEEKYKKAMVSIAQLDNEKQALTYQVDCLKDRLEDEGEVSLNLKDELHHKCKDYNWLHREHENNLKELEKFRQMVLERDRLLEENGIDLSDGEQQDIIANDISVSRINGTLPLDSSIEMEQSGSIRSRGSSRKSSGATEDREALLEQIKSLKEEVSELRRENEIDFPIRIKGAAAAEDMRRSDEDLSITESHSVETELEKSETFEDVTEEAREMRINQRLGMIVNNNEKNEDFDVIDHNLQAEGEVSNFEDKSYERSSTMTESMTESVGGSYASGAITEESIESEKPLEISVNTGLLDVEHHSQLNREFDEENYDIVETDDDKGKILKDEEVENDEMAADHLEDDIPDPKTPVPGFDSTSNFFYDNQPDQGVVDSELSETIKTDVAFELKSQTTSTNEGIIVESPDNIVASKSDNTVLIENMGSTEEHVESSAVNSLTIESKEQRANSEFEEISGNNKDNPNDFQEVQTTSDKVNEEFHDIDVPDSGSQHLLNVTSHDIHIGEGSEAGSDVIDIQLDKDDSASALDSAGFENTADSSTLGADEKFRKPDESDADLSDEDGDAEFVDIQLSDTTISRIAQSIVSGGMKEKKSSSDENDDLSEPESEDANSDIVDIELPTSETQAAGVIGSTVNESSFVDIVKDTAENDEDEFFDAHENTDLIGTNLQVQTPKIDDIQDAHMKDSDDLLPSSSGNIDQDRVDSGNSTGEADMEPEGIEQHLEDEGIGEAELENVEGESFNQEQKLEALSSNEQSLTSGTSNDSDVAEQGNKAELETGLIADTSEVNALIGQTLIVADKNVGETDTPDKNLPTEEEETTHDIEEHEDLQGTCEQFDAPASVENNDKPVTVPGIVIDSEADALLPERILTSEDATDDEEIDNVDNDERKYMTSEAEDSNLEVKNDKLSSESKSEDHLESCTAAETSEENVHQDNLDTTSQTAECEAVDQEQFSNQETSEPQLNEDVTTTVSTVDEDTPHPVPKTRTRSKKKSKKKDGNKVRQVQVMEDALVGNKVRQIQVLEDAVVGPPGIIAVPAIMAPPNTNEDLVVERHQGKANSGEENTAAKEEEEEAAKRTELSKESDVGSNSKDSMDRLKKESTDYLDVEQYSGGSTSELSDVDSETNQKSSKKSKKKSRKDSKREGCKNQ